jgi:hypothetical protein
MDDPTRSPVFGRPVSAAVDGFAALVGSLVPASSSSRTQLAPVMAALEARGPHLHRPRNIIALSLKRKTSAAL